jgi:hypothetical protein
VTNAARINFDPNPTGLRLGNVTFDQLQRSASTRDLNCTHLVRHELSIALLTYKCNTCSGSAIAEFSNEIDYDQEHEHE